MLQKGADVNTEGGLNISALVTASRNGDLGIVQLLVQYGADINAQGGFHGNALQAASKSECQEVVEALIQMGANVNTQGGYYGNALQAASQTGCRQVVEALIQHGADVNAQGGRYGSALQAASQKGSEEVIKTLLQNGANVNAQGGHYGDALQAAVCGLINLQVLAMTEDMLSAAATLRARCVETLIRNGADVNVQGIVKILTRNESPSFYTPREIAERALLAVLAAKQKPIADMLVKELQIRRQINMDD